MNYGSMQNRGGYERLKSVLLLYPDTVLKRKQQRHRRKVRQRENSHPPIISEEVFASVQIEKERRTNQERTSNGVRRKETRYKSTYEHYTLDLRQEDDPSNI